MRSSDSASCDLLLSVEPLILDQLDGLEEAGAATSPTISAMSRRPSSMAQNSPSLAEHVAAEVLALEDVEVGEATAAATGWPPKVKPWAKLSLALM